MPDIAFPDPPWPPPPGSAGDLAPGSAGAARLQWLLIRRLCAEDRAVLTGHLLALPARDRRARFDGQASDAAIMAHCEALDLGGTLIGFAAFEAPGVMAAAALGFPDPAGGVELAVTVLPAWRLRGLGADLVARVCAVACAEHGSTRAIFDFHPGNWAIQGLVRHLGGLVWLDEGRGVVALPGRRGQGA